MLMARVKVVASLVFLAIGTAVALFLGRGSPYFGPWFDACWMLAAGYATVEALRTFRALPRGPSRVAWGWFALGCGGWTFGQLAWSLERFSSGAEPPFPSPADLGYISLPVAFLVGLILYGGSASGPLTAFRRFCDLAILLAASSMVVVLVAAEELTAVDSPALKVATGLFWTIPTLAAAGYATLSLVWDELHGKRLVLRLISLGLALHALANGAYAIVQLHPEGVGATWTNVVWVAAFLPLAWAADLERRRTPADALHRTEDPAGALSAMLPEALMLMVVLVFWLRAPVITPQVLRLVLPIGAVLLGFAALREVGIARIAKRLQAARRQSEERLRLMLDHMPAGCITCDAALRSTYWNAAAERIFGYTFEEVRGRNVLEILAPPEIRGSARDAFDALARGESLAATSGESLHRSGRRIWVEWHSVPLRDAAGELHGALSMCLDVTDRRRLEERAQRLERMESLGQLAGGIAHDFNNLLTILRGHAEWLAELRSEIPESAGESIEEIGRAVDRAAHLTQQLLLFSRRQVLQRRRLDLHEVVGDTARMLRRLVGAQIEIRITLAAAEHRWVEADPAVLQQVLVNLVVNAKDAMPEGGQISLRVSAVPGSASAGDPPRASSPGLVELVVADTGQGIAPEDLPRVFEPFYTTKGIGKGTGLGLSTVYGVVTELGGKIDIASELGRGTTVRIQLPEAAAPPDEVEVEAKREAGQGETVLVVEDEEHVRGLVRRILERAGYRVLVAVDGADACRIWELHGSEVGLLLTDLVMPGDLSGRDLALRLRAARADLPVLYMSGYGADVLGSEEIAADRAIFLAKPFTVAALLEAVRGSLERPTPGAAPAGQAT
jgi:PAS domain S-box-containing protein